jgi:pimeloyl-ACP methyl ester carboxylesterase
MKNLFLVSLFILALGACKDDASEPILNLTEKSIMVNGKSITTYYTDNQRDVLVVFESGLGDNAAVWQEKNILTKIAQKADVMIYDRTGYGKSLKGGEPRDIAAMSADLAKIISQLSENKQVVLVSHSLGGMIMRDYAIKNPTKARGILFIDPSHEDYNILNQSQEDEIYNLFKNNFGSDYGATMEARQLIENTEYMATLPQLPNIPVIVLTDMLITAENNTIDRQKWYNAHEKLKTGLNDFTHLTTQTGHYIQRKAPDLVIEQLNILLSKIKNKL